MGFMQSTLDRASQYVSPVTRETLLLRSFGLSKIPMLAFCTPRVVEFTEEVCAIRIPLNWRTRNHLGSMYFGALAVGADCAGGYAAMYHIRQAKRPVALIFKDFKADFVRRPMHDVVFRSTDGLRMARLVEQAISTRERVNETVRVDALCRDEAVARFELTLSLKLKGKENAQAA